MSSVRYQPVLSAPSSSGSAKLGFTPHEILEKFHAKYLSDVENVAEEEQEWCLPTGSSTPAVPKRYKVAELALLGTHVNAAEVMLSGGKLSGASSKKGKGKKNKSTGKEVSLACGNDSKMPWLRMPSSRAVQIDTIDTVAAFDAFTTSTSVPTFYSLDFRINSVSNFTSYSGVFDQYKINLVEVLIEPQVTEVTAPTGDVGEYISAIDIDDVNTPTSYSQLCEYTQLVQTRGTSNHYHRWVPTVAVAVYSGAFTSFAATTSMWLDCGSAQIQHYGLKVASTTAATAQKYIITYKLHCSWRALH